MTQKDKELLIKDLCARIPYGVKVEYKNEIFGVEHVCPMYEEVKFDTHETWTVDVSDIKPYLFPISSMTEEQKEEYYSLADDVTIKPGQGSYFGIKIHCIKLGISDNPHEGVWDWIDLDAIDWLNKNHFDYRGLIEKGIALDATGLGVY